MVCEAILVRCVATVMACDGAAVSSSKLEFQVQGPRSRAGSQRSRLARVQVGSREKEERFKGLRRKEREIETHLGEIERRGVREEAEESRFKTRRSPSSRRVCWTARFAGRLMAKVVDAGARTRERRREEKRRQSPELGAFAECVSSVDMRSMLHVSPENGKAPQTQETAESRGTTQINRVCVSVLTSVFVVVVCVSVEPVGRDVEGVAVSGVPRKTELLCSHNKKFFLQNNSGCLSRCACCSVAGGGGKTKEKRKGEEKSEGKLRACHRRRPCRSARLHVSPCSRVRRKKRGGLNPSG